MMDDFRIPGPNTRLLQTRALDLAYTQYHWGKPRDEALACMVMTGVSKETAVQLLNGVEIPSKVLR